MKYIIDIPKEKYEWIKKNNPNADPDSIVGAVANGIPVSNAGDLISRSELKEAIAEFHQKQKDRLHNPLWGSISVNNLNDLIDNAPTVEYTFEEAFQKTVCDNKLYCPARLQGECRTCRHRDPEDKKCECGGLERQGCLFPVSDDYYCKFYEKDSEE